MGITYRTGSRCNKGERTAGFAGKSRKCGTKPRDFKQTTKPSCGKGYTAIYKKTLANGKVKRTCAAKKK